MTYWDNYLPGLRHPPRQHVPSADEGHEEVHPRPGEYARMIFARQLRGPSWSAATLAPG